MTPQEALEKAVTELLELIESNYQKLLRDAGVKDNALSRHIYLSEMIDLMDKADNPNHQIMNDALKLRLYLLRSDVSVDAEFMRIAYSIEE